MTIKLCDYTLRAGGITSAQRAAVAAGLADAGIEHIELGCLSAGEALTDYYPLAEGAGASCSVMIDTERFDCAALPECNGKIARIRLPLRQGNADRVLKAVAVLAAKGYSSVCDLVGAYDYSDRELISLCESFGSTGIDQLNIVDGARLSDSRLIQRIALILDNNLAASVKIGLRSEGNSGLARFVADSFLGTAFRKERALVIEGTLLGRGTGYGSVCTECMADMLSEDFGARYDYGKLIRLISDAIPEANRDPGNIGAYHPVFYLAAKNQVDGDYGRYFLSRGIPLSGLDALLKKLAETQRFCLFDESVAEQMLA